MFSLIITIISIALVAALALATLYYGSDAFNRGSQDAQASKLLVQGQQITGALTLYQVDHGSLPNTNDLSFLTQVSPVTGKVYLKTVPVAYLSPDLVQSAVAADIEWQMVPEKNTIYTVQPLDLEVCRAVNKRVRNDDGVLNVVSTQYASQCYEETSGVYKLFVSPDRSFEAAGISPAKIVSSVAPVADVANAAWAIAPNSVVAVTPPESGGGTGASTGFGVAVVQGTDSGMNVVISGNTVNITATTTRPRELSAGFLAVTNTANTAQTFNATNSAPGLFSLEELVVAYGMDAATLNGYAEANVPGAVLCGANTELQPGGICLLYVEQVFDECVNQTAILSGTTINFNCGQVIPYLNIPQNRGIILMGNITNTPYDGDPETYVLPVVHNFGTVNYPRAVPAEVTLTVFNTHNVEVAWTMGFNASEFTLVAGPVTGVADETVLWQNFEVTSSCGANVPARSTCELTLKLKTNGLVQPDNFGQAVPMVSGFPYWAELRIGGGNSTQRTSRWTGSTLTTQQPLFVRWQLSGY